jgi:hypothetical protein
MATVTAVTAQELKLEHVERLSPCEYRGFRLPLAAAGAAGLRRAGKLPEVICVPRAWGRRRKS